MSVSKGVYDFSWSPQVVASVNANVRTRSACFPSRAHRRVLRAQGDTPLHLAARHNDVELARELILKGASWDVSNKEGVTPADIAQTKLFTDITKLFSGARAAFRTFALATVVGLAC